jgi:FAD/FMN-containing dehydrogenase
VNFIKHIKKLNTDVEIMYTGANSANDSAIVFTRDASYSDGDCIAVMYPESAQDVVDIVASAKEANVRLKPRGGGSSLTGSSVPNNSIVVSTSKLNSIDLGNGTSVKCGAGVILEDLVFQLASRKKQFPVVPASKYVATIGGMFATNAVGLRGIRFGKMSDWVKNIEFVDGKGRIQKIDSKKALTKLAGKEGAFGILTELELKVIDQEDESSVDIFQFGQIQELLNKVNELPALKDITAVEFMNPICSQKMGESSKYLLWAEYSSNTIGEFRTPEEIDNAWKIRNGIAAVLNAEGLPIIEDPYVKSPDAQHKLLKWLEERGIPAFGHIGYGIFHPHFSRKQKSLINDMFKFVLDIGGKVTGEHGYGPIKKDFMSEDVKAEYREVRERYDPNKIFDFYLDEDEDE